MKLADPHIALTKPSELLVIIIIIIPSFTSTKMYNVFNWEYDFYRHVPLIFDSFYSKALAWFLGVYS